MLNRWHISLLTLHLLFLLAITSYMPLFLIFSMYTLCLCFSLYLLGLQLLSQRILHLVSIFHLFPILFGKDYNYISIWSIICRLRYFIWIFIMLFINILDLPVMVIIIVATKDYMICILFIIFTSYLALLWCILLLSYLFASWNLVISILLNRNFILFFINIKL